MSTLRERTAFSTLRASAEGDALLAALLVLGGIALAWVLTYLTGGTKNAGPHLFYVPLVIAAVRFGYSGSLLVSVAAGLTAGPGLPLDVDTGAAQGAVSWMSRLGAFVLVGLLVAYLSRHSLPWVGEEIANHRFRQELAEALDARELRLEYQPIIDLRTGDLVGAEALVRWDRGKRSPMSPAEFVPRAERTGCIHDLTAYVLDEALATLRRWRSTVLRADAEFTLTVNISASDLVDPGFTGVVLEALARHDVQTDWVVLEVTETALVGDFDAAVRGLDALRSAGLRVAIDDFGTGESSLGKLHQFSVDVMKLDRLFIGQLEHHERGDVLVRGVIALANALGVTTIAEGVETDEQAQAVREMGCDRAQGYVFSRPRPPEELAALLADPTRTRAANLLHVAPRTGVDVSSSSPAPR